MPCSGGFRRGPGSACLPARAPRATVCTTGRSSGWTTARRPPWTAPTWITGRPGGPRGNLNRRTIDLGYASTGHRSQGITLDRALVRVAGAEDREWFYVAATRAARQQADRAADRQRQARRAQQEHLAYQERHPGLLAADRARTRELAWRSQVELRALELERPDWLRELSEPPATVKGRRAWRQAAVVILQYRERYGITDPDHALGPEPRYGNLEQRRHHRTARQAIERLHERQRTMRERRLGQHERSHADQPRTRPSRADQPRSVRADERQRGGREREAG
jgi:hypothetical protein